MILNFLTNKINLILMICLGYFLFGYMMSMNNIPFPQKVLIFVIISTVHITVHLLGVSKGILIATLHKKELNTFLKILDEHEESGKPIDLDEIDKIIKEEFEEK